MLQIPNSLSVNFRQCHYKIAQSTQLFAGHKTTRKISSEKAQRFTLVFFVVLNLRANKGFCNDDTVFAIASAIFV